MNALFCALTKEEFNRVSTATSAHQIWHTLQVTHEGTNKVKDKGKSQAGGLGLDVGHEDRTRINLSCLRLSNFLRFTFSFIASYLFA